MPRSSRFARLVVPIAVALVLAATGVRAWVAARGYFYWDDLILTGRAATEPFWQAVVYDHDGHFMPLGFAAAWVANHLAPLQYWPQVTMLVGLQLSASLATLRVLLVVLGRRLSVLILLLGYVLCPLTLPSFAWWAAGLNALPLQFALAWVTADAIMAVRTGRRRYSVSAIAVTALALLAFEKAAVVPFVAFGAVWLWQRFDGAGAVRRTWAGAQGLWIGSLVVLAAWAAVYLTVVQSRFSLGGLGKTWELLRHGTSLGVVPTIVGGPWLWDRWPPSPPWATPPTVTVVLGWVALATAVAVTVVAKRYAGAIWVALGAYVLGEEFAMVLTRADAEVANELAQTLRYQADAASVAVIAVALMLAAPRRERAGARWLSAFAIAPAGKAWAVGLAALFTASSLGSAAGFTHRWTDNPTEPFLQRARVELAAHQDVPLLDQPVSIWVLLPVTRPYNAASSVFAPLRERPEFSTVTTQLRRIDDDGYLQRAVIAPARELEPGPEPGCGTRVSGRSAIALDGPLFDWEWTLALNTFTGTPTTLRLRFDGEPSSEPESAAREVTLTVPEGLATHYIRLVGGGTHLIVEPTEGRADVCVGGGPVGQVERTGERIGESAK